MGVENDNQLNQEFDSQSVLTFARLLKHLNNPQNLLTYLVLTAWLKFMGVASHIPSITIG